MQTLFRAITICVSLFILMAGVFTRPELVVEPGLAQLGAMVIVMTATIGVTFSLQAQFVNHAALDRLLRIALAAVALIALFHPDREVAVLACVLVGLFIGFWVLRHRNARVAARVGAG